MTAIRSTTSCRPTRTRCSIWPARRRSFSPTCCIWGSPRAAAGPAGKPAAVCGAGGAGCQGGALRQAVFMAAALLPMTLHLAASFSRDAPAGVQLCLYGAVARCSLRPRPGQGAPCPAGGAAALRRGAGRASLFLPLAALLLLVPAARLGRHAKGEKNAAIWLSACCWRWC